MLWQGGWHDRTRTWPGHFKIKNQSALKAVAKKIAMAVPAQPDHEEYGAIRGAARRTSSRALRIMLVASAIAMCMAATVMLSSSSHTENDDEIELEIITPQEKLEHLVNDLAIHSPKMTVSQMESKLDEWRNDPDTLLDLPEAARTQVSAALDMFGDSTSIVLSIT